MRNWLRQGLGPLGRYRPGWLRKDMTRGFRAEGGMRLPAWVPRCTSPEERLLDQLDLDGKVVYDIGAHTGAYSLFFSRQVGPRGTVVAFEPQSDNFAGLAQRLRRNGVSNVRALEVALGARAELRQLYALPGMSTTPSLAADARTLLRRRAGCVRVEALDQLVARLRLPLPHFVKIDVEGLEVEVMEGAADTLARSRPGLLIEVHGADREHKTRRVQELASLLGRLGYQITHAESGRIVTASWSGAFSGHLFAQAA